jgi:hypothetical protein
MTRKNTNHNEFLIISDTNWNREWFAMGLHSDFTTLTTEHHTTEENAIRAVEDMIDAVRGERGE